MKVHEAEAAVDRAIIQITEVPLQHGTPTYILIADANSKNDVQICRHVYLYIIIISAQRGASSSPHSRPAAACTPCLVTTFYVTRVYLLSFLITLHSCEVHLACYHGSCKGRLSCNGPLHGSLNCPVNVLIIALCFLHHSMQANMGSSVGLVACKHNADCSQDQMSCTSSLDATDTPRSCATSRLNMCPDLLHIV